MNESNPEAAPVQPIPAPSYADRSTGLTIFGILTLLLGGFCALLVLMMLVGQMVLTRTNPPQANFVAILPVTVIYGGLAVALVWLGIGSMLARRWARALLLIFAWSWLITGLMVLVIMACVMPQSLAQQFAANGSSAAPVPIEAVMAGMFLFLSILFIVCPLSWILFYKSPHVKATCEARDPVTRWTDACPLPVLALSLWLLPGASMLLFMPISAHGVMPFFGMFLSGLAGSVLCLVMAVLWGYAAWLLYRLDVRGWWLILTAFLVVLVSSVLTYARHDMPEVYHLMGYPEAQIEQIQKTASFTGRHLTWLMLFCMAPFVAYILFIKKYFNPKAPA